MSWIAFAATCIAVYLSAKKNSWNWIVGMISNVLWILYAIQNDLHALMFCNSLLFFLGLYGLHQWTKKYEK